MNEIKNIFDSVNLVRRDQVKEQFVTDVSGVVKNYAPEGALPDDIRNELLHVTSDSVKMLQEMKKVYLRRKNILTKIVGQAKSEAPKDEKAAIGTHVQNMLIAVNERLAKIDSDIQELSKEIDLIRKKQI